MGATTRPWAADDPGPAPDGPGSAPDGPGRADGGARVPPEFRRVWLVAIVRGVLFLVLGLLLLIDPVREDLDRLRWVLGLFLVADGVVAALAGLWHRHQPAWQAWFTQSAVDVVFGVVVLAWPDLTPRALYYVLAAWAIALGVTVVVTAGVLARSRDIEWSWALTAGVVAFLFGILLVLRPQDGGDVQQTTALVFAFFAWVTGAIHVVTGFATRTLALELRSLRRQVAELGGEVVPARLVLGGSSERPGAASGPRAPEPVPASAPEVLPDASAGVVPGALPDASAGVVPGALPDESAGVVPGALPDESAGVVPGALPDEPRDAPSDVPPDERPGLTGEHPIGEHPIDEHPDADPLR